eukprot:TRINITY_DN6751_c0_g1_i1.p1 TRINITY_DN6751_c0_g1~~TRINITY_DN6751_c0_g1_i1.p1  ORF type:complete len:218 (+),score=58.16 TRINITY_DN6751_c0_g1_i1:79-654(+)
MAEDEVSQPASARPCSHNDWDDVRTRKGFKVLRCRVCQRKWKLPSSSAPRCMPFLHECCREGDRCALLHVRRKKTPLEERVEQFGADGLRSGKESYQPEQPPPAGGMPALLPAEPPAPAEVPDIDLEEDEVTGWDEPVAVSGTRALSLPAAAVYGWGTAEGLPTCAQVAADDARRAMTLPPGSAELTEDAL